MHRQEWRIGTLMPAMTAAMCTMWAISATPAIGATVTTHATTAVAETPAMAPPMAAALANPAPAGARLPRLVSLPGAGVLMSWVEGTPAASKLRFSVLREGHWGPVGEVARGAHWFLNWADFPAVVAIDARFWVAHWRVVHPGRHSDNDDIVIAVSMDAGATWSPPSTPHRDGVGAEHGFVSVVAVGDAAGLIWLDGREQAQLAAKVSSAGPPGNYALRYATIARDGTIGAEVVVDADVCTCCQTAAVAAGKGVVALWRGHTQNDARDHRVARLVDGQWTPAQPLGAEGWRLNACPVNGPALSALGDDVAAVWFSGADQQPRVRFALSSDAGAHFGAAAGLDVAAPLGRVGVAWADNDAAVVTWLGHPLPGLRTAPLHLRRLSRDGRAGPLETVATVDAGHASGVPQIATESGCALLAWTGSAPAFGIRTVRAPITTACRNG